MSGRTARSLRMVLLYSHGRVAALHGHEDFVGAVLHRQVQVAHQFRDLGVRLNQPG